VGLSRLEAKLLYELALAPERKLNTDVLLQRLDPRQENPGLRDNLPVTISRLRQNWARAGQPT
jgi:DNA-binding response OmpR family regulator